MVSQFSSVTGRVPTKYTIVKGNAYSIDDWLTRNKINPIHLRFLDQLIAESFLTETDWKSLDENGSHSDRVLKEVYKRAGKPYRPRTELIAEKIAAEKALLDNKNGKPTNPLMEKGPIKVLEETTAKEDKPAKMKKVGGAWVSAE